LFILPEIVKGHLETIYQKLDVGKRREAVEMVKEIGIFLVGLILKRGFTDIGAAQIGLLHHFIA